MIQNGSSVAIEYTLKLDDGTTVDSNVGNDPLTYEQGAKQILPALEAVLEGKEVGDTETVKLAAEEGYGAVNPEAFQEVDLETVPEDSRQEGAMLIAKSPDGRESPIRVHEVKDESIILDFNHPLAGQALNFEVKVLAVDTAAGS